jgi:hypothetical protein
MTGARRATYSYQWQFSTSFRSTFTVLQSYLGVITNVGATPQNLLGLIK